MTSKSHMPKLVTYQEVLKLAWPASVAASVTPLLGAVDVWALAHSGRPLDIAAVGLGAIIFSLAYWTFGFFRMSVAGLTAQASGAGDLAQERAALARGVALSGGIGFLLLMFQWPIGAVTFPLLTIDTGASAQTIDAAKDYYAVRILGAPFALATYATFGFLTAKGRTDYLMIASLAITLLNAGLDYLFVVEFGWGARGVALGTLIAEVFGFFFSAIFVINTLRKDGSITKHWRDIDYFHLGEIRKTLSINRDIFIRTLLLAFSFAWFVQRGSAFGDVTLAANQVLLQLFLFTGLALDGTAIAAETLVGRAIGDRDKARGQARLRAAIKATFAPALAAAILFTGFYLFAGDAIIHLLTPEGDIRETSSAFLFWIIISPLIVVLGFQLDGIFIGATMAKQMRNGMIISVGIFVLATIWLGERYGNHGLWAAFSLFFVVRAATLARDFPQLFDRAHLAPTASDTAENPSARR